MLQVINLSHAHEASIAAKSMFLKLKVAYPISAAPPLLSFAIFNLKWNLIHIKVKPAK